MEDFKMEGETFCSCPHCGKEVPIPESGEPGISVSVEKKNGSFEWHMVKNEGHRRFLLQTHITRQPKTANEIKKIIMDNRDNAELASWFKKHYKNIDHYPISFAYGPMLRNSISENNPRNNAPPRNRSIGNTSHQVPDNKPIYVTCSPPNEEKLPEVAH